MQRLVQLAHRLFQMCSREEYAQSENIERCTVLHFMFYRMNQRVKWILREIRFYVEVRIYEYNSLCAFVYIQNGMDLDIQVFFIFYSVITIKLNYHLLSICCGNGAVVNAKAM